MPRRERDYGEEYRRSQEIAFAIGYDSAQQRREIKSATSPEELREALEPVVRARAAEGDNQSLGNIYADVYRSWKPEARTFDAIWQDLEVSP